MVDVLDATKPPPQIDGEKRKGKEKKGEGALPYQSERSDLARTRFQNTGLKSRPVSEVVCRNISTSSKLFLGRYQYLSSWTITRV